MTGFLEELEHHVQAAGKKVPIYLLGSATMVLLYGGRERTKDVDVVDTQNEALRELAAFAKKGSPVHDKHGLYLEVVPPIYPLASGWKKRARRVELAGVELIEVFALDLHDVVISKLRRFRGPDLEDIATLTRHPEFKSPLLLARYESARENLKLYWPDELEKIDRNFNRIREETLGEPPIDWRADYDDLG